MVITKTKMFFLLVVSFFLIGCQGSSDVDDFPNKSIKLVVAFSPGGGTDTQARIISKYANKYLKEELVIINKPGGGGQVGWNDFSNVKANGYTLTAYNLPHIITQPLVSKTSFDRDTFEPIVNWGGDPTVFAVKHDSEIQDLENLIVKAKKDPESITVGHSGKFVGQHLAILQLESAANIDLEDVSFQGSAEAYSALLGGHIDVVAGNLSGITRLGADVQPLGITTAERHSLDPDIPTVAELGYPDVIMSTDRGIAARQGTPPEIIDKLEEAFADLLEDEEFIMDMEEAGAGMLRMDRDETIKEIELRTNEYEQLLNNIGISN